MKLLLDENIGASVADALRRQGHDIVWIGDNFSGSLDSAVLAKAERERRVLITKDKDFGELAFRAGQAHSGVVLLRLDDERADNTIRVLEVVLRAVSKQKAPYFVVASDQGFRLRGRF